MLNFKSRDTFIVILNLALLVGVMTLFSTCDAKDDGSWMLCHWAGQVVLGLAGVMFIISVLKFFVNDEVKKGLDFALIPLAAFTAYLPNNIIPLCKMEMMRCHVLFNPAVLFISFFLIATVMVNNFKPKKKG